MSQYEPTQDNGTAPAKRPNRGYIIAAVVLVVVIVVCIILLITEGIPALVGNRASEAVLESTATPAPTATEATATQDIPSVELSMKDTDTPLYEFDGAGARPGVEWTGFFGTVVDTAGAPVDGVTVIVWDEYGQPAVEPIQTDESGAYEVRLADEPLAGMWSIQLLTGDSQPASHYFSFRTDEDTQAGIQQIQVLWTEAP